MVEDGIEIVQIEPRQEKSNGHRADNKKQVRQEKVKLLMHSLLAVLGQDPNREGLRQTPQRMARMYEELLAGDDVDIKKLVNGALFDVQYDEMVVVKDIEFYSLCEHHLLPFFGQAHVAYVPGDYVIGLSKIPRIVEMYARRLQVQERMTQQIAQQLEQVLRPRGVAVVVEGLHLCASMRGVRQQEARMRTSIMRGVFRDDTALRMELLQQIQRGSNGM